MYFGLFANDSYEISRDDENDDDTEKCGQGDPVEVVLSEIVTDENFFFSTFNCFWIKDTTNNTNDGNNYLDDDYGDDRIFGADPLMVR